MGIYFRTVFYKDVRQRDEGFVVLADIDPILEEVDRERGYIVKEELIRYYGSKISVLDISEYSRIEEQISSSHGPGYEIEVSLPIR